MQFAGTVEDDIESLMVPWEPAVAPILFRRLPQPEIATRRVPGAADRRLPPR
jgi:hypothetical protein